MLELLDIFLSSSGTELDMIVCNYIWRNFGTYLPLMKVAAAVTVLVEATDRIFVDSAVCFD